MPQVFKAKDGKEYKAVIGMEVHAELRTASKMYCRCRASFGDPPNTNVCPVCMALPGCLPVVNSRAVVLGVRAALALHCDMTEKRYAQFARKHYFYPDLPKGYQITMYAHPLAFSGWLEIWADGEMRRIGIERAHIEEDTAKLSHETGGTSSIDYNRAGIPLLEVVSKPELRTAEEAKSYLRELRDILRRNAVSDGNMEEGSFRCEANISLRELGSDILGVKSEIKNLNSFLAVEKAINYELKRHLDMYDRGEKITPDTRGWDDSKAVTFHLRYKERADEYRYFPEPDLPDLFVSDDIYADAEAGLASPPFEEKKMLMDKYGLNYETANLIVGRDGAAALYSETLSAGAEPEEAAKWLTGEFYAYLNEKGIEINSTKLSGANLAELISLVAKGVVSGTVAKDLIRDISRTGENASIVVRKKGLQQLSGDDDLIPIVQKIIRENPKIVEQYKSGKKKVATALVGKIMRATEGKANPERVGELLHEFLEK